MKQFIIWFGAFTLIFIPENSTAQKWNLQFTKGLTFSHAVVSKPTFYESDFSLHQSEVDLGIDLRRTLKHNTFAGVGVKSFRTNSIVKRYDSDDRTIVKEIYRNQRFVTAKFLVGQNFRFKTFIVSPELSWQPAFNFAPTLNEGFFKKQRQWGKNFASRGEIAFSIKKQFLKKMYIGVMPAYNFTFENLYVKNPDTIGINSFELNFLLSIDLK